MTRLGPAPAGRRRWRASIAVLFLMLGACAAPEPAAGFGGRILVLGPEPGFDPTSPPDDWYAARVAGGGRTGFSVAEKDGVLALRLDNAGGGSFLGRRIVAPLLAMPYLRWGWHLESASNHPVGRLLPARPPPAAVPLYLFVAFRGGVQAGDVEVKRDLLDTFREWFGSPKLNFDRAMLLAWSANDVIPVGLDRSTVPPRLVLRRGLRGAGRWVLETVDLSHMYAWLWPRDRIAEVEVVFVAAGAGPTKFPSVGYVAEVILSK